MAESPGRNMLTGAFEIENHDKSTKTFEKVIRLIKL